MLTTEEIEAFDGRGARERLDGPARDALVSEVARVRARLQGQEPGGVSRPGWSACGRRPRAGDGRRRGGGAGAR